MQRVGIKDGSAIAAKGKKDYQSYGKKLWISEAEGRGYQ